MVAVALRPCEHIQADIVTYTARTLQLFAFQTLPQWLGIGSVCGQGERSSSYHHGNDKNKRILTSSFEHQPWQTWCQAQHHAF